MKVRLALTTLLLALATTFAHAHCQIPCGIYGDEARFDTMLEHTHTITKSMTEIKKLSGDSASANQLARWVQNKEAHAQMIQDIVAEYFLAQRVKDSQADYTERLKLSHKIIVLAMKTKQSTDLAYANGLADAIKAFQAVYFAK